MNDLYFAGFSPQEIRALEQSLDRVVRNLEQAEQAMKAPKDEERME